MKNEYKGNMQDNVRFARFKMADSSQLVLSLILDQATKYHLNVRSTIGQETISISESAVSAEL